MAKGYDAVLSYDLFDEARDEVSGVLQRGPFMQFRGSETFMRLRKNWAREVNDSEPGNTLNALAYAFK